MSRLTRWYRLIAFFWLERLDRRLCEWAQVTADDDERDD